MRDYIQFFYSVLQGTKSSACPEGTQVCQQDGTQTHPPVDRSCGSGPATWNEGVSVDGLDGATGVTLWAQGGLGCYNGVARNTKIQIVCLNDAPGRSEGEVDKAQERK